MNDSGKSGIAIKYSSMYRQTIKSNNHECKQQVPVFGVYLNFDRQKTKVDEYQLKKKITLYGVRTTTQIFEN